ncbi:MAG: TrkA family potassium uptake protein, partial [Dehalococcoidia bacterium]
MYIIIVGGGKVGYYLAKQLVEDGHEVLVIEKDAAKCQQIADELGDIAVRGDGCEGTTLDAAGTGRADLFIAVTGDDEDNLVACQVAKNKFDVRRTVARINNPKNEIIFKKLGIDTTVSSTALLLANIEQELPSHPLIPLLTLKGSGLEIVEV